MKVKKKRKKKKKHVHIKHLLYIATSNVYRRRSSSNVDERNLHSFYFHKEKSLISSNSGL